MVWAAAGLLEGGRPADGAEAVTDTASRGFELTEHTADVGIRAWGGSAAEVFEQAALGMFSLMYETEAVKPAARVAIELEAPDGELLLAAWLNELLYVTEARRVVFARVEVAVVGPAESAAALAAQEAASAAAAKAAAAPAASRAVAASGASGEAPAVRVPWRLRAAGVGEAVDARRHSVRHVVKAATLHGLSLEQTADGWQGHVLLDV